MARSLQLTKVEVATHDLDVRRKVLIAFISGYLAGDRRSFDRGSEIGVEVGQGFESPFPLRRQETASSQA